MQSEEVDVLVVGAGLAGLVTALSAGTRHVTILCPDLSPESTASALAQGGIAAACGRDDTSLRHALDTMRAGAGESWFPAVRLLCSHALTAIHWLERQGVLFDRADGLLSLHREAAHSRARVLHVGGDATGAGLVRALHQAARASATIAFRPGHTALSLCRDSNRVTGVVAADPDGRPVLIKAHDVVLATGGIGQLYCYTTNPASACGDGLAMALEGRARTAGLEFVQFHPTALAVGTDPLPLVTEALRGAGAMLVDDRGERVMLGAHPAADLAPRDVVARGVWNRMQSGHRVYLDATRVFAEQAEAFPSVRSLCAQHGIDPVIDRIPIVPAAHYHMGGVAVDLEGRSSIAHLWACGEVASSGVHGANRLASNSLLEAVVFGRRLGAALASESAQREPCECRADFDIAAGAAASSEAVWQRLRFLMWRHVGIVRNARGLQATLSELVSLMRETAPEDIRVRRVLRLAWAIAAAALLRGHSRGAHFRADYHPRSARHPTQSISAASMRSPKSGASAALASRQAH